MAAAQIDGGKDVVDAARRDPSLAPLSDKMKALLAIAEQVQRGGKNVRDEHITTARAQGATDVEIHDTVLIAAAFCMYNRYVDGLAATTPADPRVYEAMADVIVKNGYVR
jgi:alkylhydroperoxidase family enzyme